MRLCYSNPPRSNVCPSDHGAGAEFQESGRCLWDNAAARQRSEAGWQVAGEVCEDEETVEKKRNQKGVIVEVVEDRRQACRC